jgi:hypothetical protein
MMFKSLLVLFPIWTSPKWTDLFERLTLKPVAYPRHEQTSSFPPTVLILYWAQDVTPTIEGTYLTVILNEALGGMVPE